MLNNNCLDYLSLNSKSWGKRGLKIGRVKNRYLRIELPCGSPGYS